MPAGALSAAPAGIGSAKGSDKREEWWLGDAVLVEIDHAAQRACQGDHRQVAA
jgi:hypothetical protein